MRHFIIKPLSVFVFIMLLFVNFTAHATSTPATLRELATTRNFFIGGAFNLQGYKTDETYGKVFAREYNMVTPELELKWAAVRPSENRYDFTALDEVMSFAQQHAMMIRGHNLITYSAMPQWLEQGNFSPDKVRSLMTEHIKTIMLRYKGKIPVYDVVNEAIDGDGNIRKEGVWFRALGPDYVEIAFRIAHEADPTAQLFYNDYDLGDVLGPKSNGIYNLVADLVKKGVPIHGVGMQMHLDLKNPPKPEALRANIERYIKLGLQVQITELDVTTRGVIGTRDEIFSKQGQVYRDVADACLSFNGCTALGMWGLTDKYSWLNADPITNEPYSTLAFGLPFDLNYQPKPAYEALRAALQSTFPK